jgi:hypothetical protein
MLNKNSAKLSIMENTIEKAVKQRGRPSMPKDEKKKSTSFYLSDATRDDLKELARDMRLSQASVIETLVNDARRKRTRAGSA